MADRNSYGKIFKVSGFTPEEIHDIECRTRQIKQVLKEQRKRRQVERRQAKNTAGCKLYNILIKTRKAMMQGKKKTRSEKVAEQIRYSYDLVEWWEIQHA